MGGTSRISREAYVRFCERLGVKFPGPTRRVILRDDPTMLLPGTLKRLPELEAMIGTGLIIRETVAVLRYHATTSGKT